MSLSKCRIRGWLVVTLILAAAACGGSSSTPSAPADDPPAPPPEDPIGAPAKLVFTVQPGAATAGEGINTQVAIQDAAGKTVTNATSAVTVVIGANPGSAVLAGTNTVSPVNGVAHFESLSLDKAATGYTLVASSDPLVGTTSGAFTITPAAAARLAFAQQPASEIAGEPMGVVVDVQDAFGNKVSSASNPITVTIETNPSGATLFGQKVIDASAGSGTFSNLNIEKAAEGYSIVASSPALISATTQSFTVAPGPVTSIWMNPGAAVLKWPHPDSLKQFTATPKDAFENVVQVAVVWSSGNPGIALVSSTGLVQKSVEIGRTTITASAGGIVASAPVIMICVPPRCSGSVVTLTDPTTVRVGEPITPPVEAYSCAHDRVQLFLGANPNNATLSGNPDLLLGDCERPTWADLRMDKPGMYTLVAFYQYPSGGWWGKTTDYFAVTE